MNPDKGR